MLSVPVLYSSPGSLLQAKPVKVQSNSGSPPSFIYSLHSEYIYTLQSAQFKFAFLGIQAK